MAKSHRDGQQPRPAQPRFLHREERKLRLLAAYYDFLNLDPECIEAFRRLRYDIISGFHLDYQAGFEAKLRDFHRRFALPRQDGIRDLLYSLALRSPPSPGLHLAPRMVPLGRIGSKTVDIPIAEVEGKRVFARVQQPAPLQPKPMPEIRYDPRWHSRDWLNEKIEAMLNVVRADLLRQADEREQQAREAGWGPVHPQHQDPQAHYLARRLYRRCVRRMGWLPIARQETADREQDQKQRQEQGEAEDNDQSSDYVDAQAVRASVHEWATFLGIPLPTIAGGRPRKNL
jgi:hypothetical protein